MTALNHTLAGVLIASQATPATAPILAFLSHFLLDMMPHFGNHKTIRPWTNQFKLYLLADLLLAAVALAFSLIIFADKWFLVIVSVGFATLPGFLWLFEHKAGPKTKWFYKFHKVIQWGESPKGWIYELLFALAAVSFILAV